MQKSNFDSFSATKYLLISPYKLRKVADLVRGKKVLVALMLLKNQPQKGSFLLYKAIHSAYSNAVNNKSLHKDDLVVDAILIDEGTKLKRFVPRARGRGFRKYKRTSHIKVGLKSKIGDNNGSKS